MELRIYYESLEQAAHFIKPILDHIHVNGQSPDVVLVRLREKISVCNEVSDILEWKSPDILITAVNTERTTEKVLFMIELSTAVYTKDHELQRADNYVPLLYMDFIHVKISSNTKRSSSKIGGDISYDDKLPLSLVYKKTGKIVYKYDWKAENDFLLVDKQYMSCPQKIKAFENLIQRGVINYFRNPSDWIHLTNKEDPEYEDRLQMLKNKADQIEDVRKLKSSRTRFVTAHPATQMDSLVIKINRFGHAMDPERGMLVYYGLITDALVTKFVMSDRTDKWYPSANAEKVRNRVRLGLNTPQDYLDCFLLAARVPNEMADEMRAVCHKSTSVQIGHIVTKYYCQLSKPLKVIFSFTNAISIHDHNDKTVLTLTFDRHFVVKKSAKKLLTPLEQFSWNEDALTYCIVHNILASNGFDLLAVSYPGAQSDRAILTQKNTGRSQPRKYVDIIMNIRHDMISLLENKYRIGGLKTDVQNLRKYKSEYKGAVVEFAKKYSAQNTTNKLKIVIGAGFVQGRRNNIDKYPFMLDLDYFIAVDPIRKTWNIWHHNPESLFQRTNGTIVLPETYVSG